MQWSEMAAAPLPVTETEPPRGIAPMNIMATYQPGVKFLRQQTLTIDEWRHIPDNPSQRDTVKHARGAVHLRKFKDYHRKVILAVLPSGEIFKVDGHTRFYMWENNMTEDVPSNFELIADVYLVADQNSLRELYYSVDGQGAVETTPDMLTGVCRNIGLKFNSTLLNQYKWGNAIYMLFDICVSHEKGRRDSTKLYSAVYFAKNELTMFDRTNPKPNMYFGSMITSAILTFMDNPVKADRFWTRYNNDKGIKDDGGYDPVHSLKNLVEEARKNKKTTTTHAYEIIGRVANAFERQESFRYKKGKIEAKSNDSFKQFVSRCKSRKVIDARIDSDQE